jgi:hypothetical protein
LSSPPSSPPIPAPINIIYLFIFFKEKKRK